MHAQHGRTDGREAPPSSNGLDETPKLHLVKISISCLVLSGASTDVSQPADTDIISRARKDCVITFQCTLGHYFSENPLHLLLWQLHQLLSKVV